MKHKPVLLRETVDAIDPKAGGVYIDATLGSGGHAEAVLDRIEGHGRLLGLDRDPEALERAARRLARFGGACRLVHGCFGDLAETARAGGFGEADGVVMDLGVSSDQLETADRGFSFMHDGPLDMRMNPTSGPTAAELIATLSEEELREVIRTLGEEPRARVIARAIVRERAVRPIVRTGQLAELVARAAGGRRGKRHPATKTFQAIRMLANREMDELERGLDGALSVLKPGGRLAVISFHSLEDRTVKRFIRRHVGRWESLQSGGRAWVGDEPRMKAVTGKPVVAGAAELERNPRARTAKLRAALRLPAS